MILGVLDLAQGYATIVLYTRLSIRLNDATGLFDTMNINVVLSLWDISNLEV